MKTLASTTALVLRDARVADADAVARIGGTAFLHTHRSHIAVATLDAIVAQLYTPQVVEACIAACDAADDAHFIVAERGGRVVGFLHYDAFGDRPELHRLYIDSTHRRQGIGQALVHELERRLPDGATYVLLVTEGNVPARRFYAAEGFRLLEREPDGLRAYRQAMHVETFDDPSEIPLLILERRVAAAPESAALCVQTRRVGDGGPPLRRWPAEDPGSEHVLVEAPTVRGDGVRLFAPVSRWLSA